MKVRSLGALALLLALALVLPAHADVLLFNSVSSTATATAVRFTRPVQSIVIRVDTGGNEAYVRVFSNVDTPAAATTAYARIEPGEALTLNHGPDTPETGTAYVAMSVVCDTAETATVRIYSQ